MVLGLHPLDLAVLGGYLILIVSVGTYVARRVRDTSHYFMGGWKFGKIVMIAQSFGAGTSSEHPVGISGGAYKIGISALWYSWKYLFVTPFYWLLAPVFRRLKFMTTSDFYERRYGAGFGAAYSAYAVAFLLAASKMLEGVTGGAVPSEWGIIGMTAAFLLYSFMGGLVSIAVTDVIQGIFVIAMSFYLIPAGLGRIGGAGALHDRLGEGMFDLWRSADISPFTIAALSLNSLVGIVVQPHIMSTVGSGRTELNARMGFTYGNFVKRICTIGWAYVGLMGAVLIPGLGEAERETCFGQLCRMLLPAGGLGLTIACIMAANLDNCATFVVNASTVFTQNIYRRYLAKGASDRHALRVGRAATLAVTAGGIAFAFSFTSVIDALLSIENMIAYMGISFFGAVVWRRANRWGAWASLLVSLAVYYGGSYWLHVRHLPSFDLQKLLRFYPGLSTMAIGVGFLALVAASLLTRPEPEGRIEDFYRRLHAPATGTEPAAEEGWESK